MNLEKVAVAIRNGEICCHEVLIGAGSHGFIYKSRKGSVHIFADRNIGIECQKETFFHELHHAYKDMRTNDFIIGIDDRQS